MDEKARYLRRRAKLVRLRALVADQMVRRDAILTTLIAYDEDDDGFQFSRGKSKKHPSKQPSIPPPIREEPPPPSQDPQPKPSTTQGKRGRPRKESLDTQPQLQPQLEPKKTPAKRRKSARLSGDQEQARPGERAPSEQHARSEIEDGRVAKTPSSGPLHVDKKRGPTKIALPFADTPVIMRNKQMRKDSSEGRRRSSSGMRGRRASSLIDSGTSNGKIKHQHEMIGGMEAETYIAMPHDEVATGDFYKHIHQDLSEPRRMKQLLVWCGTRALPPRPTGGKEDVNAVLAGM